MMSRSPDGSEPPSARAVIDRQTAYFAGGCFWAIEDRFRQVPGVMDAVCGYQLGRRESTRLEAVSRENGQCAETVRLTFASGIVSYGDLLGWFFKFHSPIRSEGQSATYQIRYRSAIFAADETQFTQALEFLAAERKTARFVDKTIDTELSMAGPFFEASKHLQNYYHKTRAGSPAPGLQAVRAHGQRPRLLRLVN